MGLCENRFSTEAAALGARLRRVASLLRSLPELTRGVTSPSLQFGPQVQTQCQQLMTAAGALEQGGLKVAVIGDFDAGKSTLISALAGKALLPMHPNPNTALVTRITHADQEAYYTCPRDGSPPRAIPGDDFRRIHHGGAVMGTDGVDHLEAQVPFPLLSHGVVLLDTPGLDNGPVDTSLTRAVMPECMGLILCTPAIHPLSERDLALLRALVAPENGEASLRPDQLFLVLTFADAGQFQDDPALMGVLMSGLQTRLVSLAGLDGAAAVDLLENRAAAVSGKLALQARLRRNPEGELASGIRVLEQQLEAFFHSLQAARLQRARSVLDAAIEFGQELCQHMRERLRQREAALTLRVDEQQQGHLLRRKLDLLDRYLADAQRDLAEQLPGLIARKAASANLCEVADPARLGLQAISNTSLNRWNETDRLRTAKVLQEAVQELSRRAGSSLFSGLSRSERIVRTTGVLRKSLLNLLAAPALTVSMAEWPVVVAQGLAWFKVTLEGRLCAAFLRSPSLQDCAKTAQSRLEAVLSQARANAARSVVKQALGSEKATESDERRRNELFLGICDAVAAAFHSVDSKGPVSACLSEECAELRLRLREPIRIQLQSRNAEKKRPGGELEAERRSVQSALQFLSELEADLADPDRPRRRADA